MGTRFAAMTKGDLADDNQRSQSTLGKIVRGRHASVVNEDQPLGVMTIDPTLQRDRFLV
jgi:hypothetical protein